MIKKITLVGLVLMSNAMMKAAHRTASTKNTSLLTKSTAPNKPHTQQIAKHEQIDLATARGNLKKTPAKTIAPTKKRTIEVFDPLKIINAENYAKHHPPYKAEPRVSLNLGEAVEKNNILDVMKFLEKSEHQINMSNNAIYLKQFLGSRYESKHENYSKIQTLIEAKIIEQNNKFPGPQTFNKTALETFITNGKTSDVIHVLKRTTKVPTRKSDITNLQDLKGLLERSDFTNKSDIKKLIEAKIIQLEITK